MTASTQAISPTGVEILGVLWQHRLVAQQQLERLLTPSASKSYMSKEITALAERGLVAYVNARERGGRKLWFLTEAGANVVGAAPPKGEPRRSIPTPDEAAGALQSHTIAVNEVGTVFVEAARQRGEDCGPMAWRHEIEHAIGDHKRGTPAPRLRADALLNYTAVVDGEPRLRPCFVELDRGTESWTVVADKARNYARLAAYCPADKPAELARGEPLWRAHYRLFPEVLVVLDRRPGVSRNVLIRRAKLILRAIAKDPICQACDALAVTICFLEDLQKYGPFRAPIFLQRDESSANFLGPASTAATPPAAPAPPAAASAAAPPVPVAAAVPPVPVAAPLVPAAAAVPVPAPAAAPVPSAPPALVVP